MARVLRMLPPVEGDTVASTATASAASDAALAEAIHSWLHAELPGEEGLVERMTGTAMVVRADGATVEETCAWTRSLVQSWLSHPANSGSRRHLRLVQAS